MNIVNRVVVILAILAVMIVIPLALIFPQQAYYSLQWAADIVRINLEWLDRLEPAARIGMRILLAAAGLAVFVVGLLLLALEVIRIRRSTVRLRDGSGELVMNGIAGHLTYYVDLLPDVLRVRPSVQRAGNGVRAAIDVAAPGGGYVLGSDHSLHDGIPVENIVTMFRVAAEYGREIYSG